MIEMQLTRSARDRRTYELGSLGTLRLAGWTSRSAVAEAGARSWDLRRVGLFKASIEATDAAGTVVGAFTGRALKRGGTLMWAGQELAPRRRRAARAARARAPTEARSPRRPRTQIFQNPASPRHRREPATAERS